MRGARHGGAVRKGDDDGGITGEVARRALDLRAQRNVEGSGTLEGGDIMKSNTKRTMKHNATRRLRVAMAILLVLTLSPLVGGLAFATGSTGAGAGEGADSASGATASGVAAATVDNATAVADDDTIWSWNDLIGHSTQNVGRIWTDKSVTTDEMAHGGITMKKAAGSDFLTALTALSSTSNLSSMSTTPLDIVLVLDTSSSMTSNTITKSDGSSETRLAALKDAANSFVASIAEENSGVTDADKQHRIAVVSFNSSATKQQDMTPCVGDEATAIQAAISNLGSSQGTHSDYGLQAANTVLTNSKRDGAKQVVVFFTDGVPTTSGSAETNFDPAIASPAVGYAKDMKDAGATIYTIGIIDTANPSADPTDAGTSNANKFLHAVSSNYPNATYVSSGSDYVWTFGDRAKSGDEDATFYKSATTADELSKIFDEISKEITHDSGYPTKTTEGYESESGYITFTDQLGDYMRVTELKTLVYNAKEYTCGTPSTTKTSSGSIDTYQFSGTVVAGVKSGDLKDIIVTVTRSNDVATGDLVQVKIPATLIPLRNFEVDLTNNTMSATSKTPVSVFYSSGLKDEVAGLLVQPDDAMTKYIAANTDKTTGKVNFYANKWSGDKDLGDVTSQFEPSSGNSYYYFTEDTPIYEDRDCKTRATSIVDGTTYYYQHSFYELTGGTTDEQTGTTSGTPEAQTKAREFPGSAATAFEGAIDTDENGSYFKKGTARLVYINELHKDKGEGNKTETAADVLNPKWNSETSVADATMVTPHLGNNGKLSVDKPATLEVSKAITVPGGYDATDFADTGFTFELNVPAAANYSFPAVVVDASGKATCDEFALAFDKDGKATQTIKQGETLQVSGLGTGWTYTVTEPTDKLPEGFTQTAPADDEGKAIAATGTLAAGQTAQASFTNAYTATGTLAGATSLAGEKVLMGRNWLESDLYTFKIEATGDTPNAPLPTDANGRVADTVSVSAAAGTAAGADNPVAFRFENITYDAPGTYYYKVYESDDDRVINQGVTASQAMYQVEVKVTDNGDGTLNIVATKTQTAANDGTEATGELIPVHTMSFTNSYAATSDYAGVKVSKTMTGRDLEKGEFAFTIAGTDDASDALLSAADRNFVNDYARTAGNPDVMTKLDGITFTQADAGKTFTFEVAEVVPADADKLPGVTCDAAKHVVKIAVADNGDGTLDVETTVDGVEGNEVAFTNAYAAEPVAYNAVADLGVYKQLTGRGWMDSDAFTFELKALTDGAPMPRGATDGTATVTVMKADVAADEHASVSFGDITYTQAGTYRYQVKEANAGQTVAGVEHSGNVATFVVKVTDLDEQGNHTGKLSAKATLETGAAGFVNTYKTTNVSYDTAAAGLNKVLTGRDWLASDEFEFVIAAKTAGAPLPQDARGNEVAKVAVTKDNAATFGFGTITFTQDMIANESTKVFEYTVTEIAPADADKIAGVAYDTHAATIKVTVTDDGLGKLTATAAVEGATFTNAYQTSLSYTGAGGLSVAKTLSGHDMAEGQFTINVVPDDAASAAALGIPEEGMAIKMPAAADGTQAMYNVLAGRNVTFTQADAGKTYGYKVSEVVGDADGYTYDKAVRTVTIAVTDDPAKAALTATTTVAGGPEGTQVFTYTKDGAVGAAAVVPFANSYFASTDVPDGTAAAVNATKTLTGRDMVAGEFSFGVRLADARTDVLSATNAADGTVAFGKLSYTSDTLTDLVADGHAKKATVDGKATWTIGYVAYENTEGLADVGITAKTQSIAFTVVVVDNGDGTLTATANMPEGGLAFANEYATGDPAKVALSGVKVLQHDEGLTPDGIAGKFTFTVSSADPAAPLPQATTATNDASGNVAFGDITFTLDDLNRALGDAGKKAEEPKAAAETTEAVADKVAATEATADEAETDAEAAGALTVAGDGAEAANAEVAAAPATKATEAAAETAATEATATPQARSYTFVYTVIETGTAPGVTNDATAKTVSIKVTDDGVGNLTAAVVGEAGKPAFAFTNTYGVTPTTSSVTDQVDVTKTLTGRDMVAGEFSFELLDGETVVATGTNAADGTVTFDAVTYTKPATYHYTVREVGAGATDDGVTYDGTTFPVTTVVADDGKGGLTVTHKLAEGDGIVFENAYAAEPTSVVIGAAKVLEGKDLADGQFTFVLTGADGTELEAVNAADGTVTFPAITFDEVGTYTYIVAEVNDAQANVTYDGATYEVTVVVTDDGKGHLAAQVTGGDDGAMVFRNVYAEPTPEPTPKVTPTPDTGQKETPKQTTTTKATTVKTGDTVFALALVTGLLLAALAGVVIAIANARKRG